MNYYAPNQASSSSGLSSSSSHSSDARCSSDTSGSRNPRSSRDNRSSTAQQPASILRKQVNWESLYFYQKSVVLYQMTVVFCRRFLPRYGDRTVDQMVQAARSGKQNIVEGFADGVTSFEMSIKLLNIARASLQELREDYADYLVSHGHALWQTSHPRYSALLRFCRIHNKFPEYEPFFSKWAAEEFANCAVTLCRMADKMIETYLNAMADEFRENGGIRERMTAARLGRRQSQSAEIATLRRENEQLKVEVANLRQRLSILQNIPPAKR